MQCLTLKQSMVKHLCCVLKIRNIGKRFIITLGKKKSLRGLNIEATHNDIFREKRC